MASNLQCMQFQIHSLTSLITEFLEILQVHFFTIPCSSSQNFHPFCGDCQAEFFFWGGLRKHKEGNAHTSRFWDWMLVQSPPPPHGGLFLWKVGEWGPAPPLKTPPETILYGPRVKMKHTLKTTKTAPQNDRLDVLINILPFVFMNYTRFGKLVASQV